MYRYASECLEEARVLFSDITYMYADYRAV